MFYSLCAAAIIIIAFSYDTLLNLRWGVKTHKFGAKVYFGFYIFILMKLILLGATLVISGLYVFMGYYRSAAVLFILVQAVVEIVFILSSAL